jgi:hypothetical protein
MTKIDLSPLNTKRMQTLESAGQLISGDREQEYGTPQDNFKHIADRWSQHVGTRIEPWQVALMMLDLKIARMATTQRPHADSFIDAAGYAALSAELAVEIAKNTDAP